MFLKLGNVQKKFGKLTILQSVNFALDRGDQCVIQGASGSGKSTLLHLIGGLESVTSGEIFVEGQEIGHLSDERKAIYRNSTVGLVFQFHYLLPSLNCLQNMLLPAQIGGHKRMKEIREKVILLSQKLGIEHCLSKSPYEISGGEQQRVNVIRALSLGPKLLLCDEPTGNLDSINSLKVVELIMDLAREAKSTLIVVTHDKEIASCFPREAVMKDGHLEMLR